MGKVFILRYDLQQKLIGTPAAYWVLRVFKPDNEDIPYQVHTSKSIVYLRKLIKEHGYDA